jgi:hypothetical protein
LASNATAKEKQKTEELIILPRLDEIAEMLNEIN